MTSLRWARIVASIFRKRRIRFFVGLTILNARGRPATADVPRNSWSPAAWGHRRRRGQTGELVTPNSRDKCAISCRILPVPEFVLHRHPGHQAANRQLLVEGGRSVLRVLRLGDTLARSFAVPSVWLVWVGLGCPGQTRCRLKAPQPKQIRNALLCSMVCAGFKMNPWNFQ
jgi:hypothetical protein